MPDEWSGIDGCDLLSPSDRAFAFDYDHSGKLDHLVLYRPGDGACYILANNSGTFSPVFQSQNGIGGYDLKDAGDRAFAFDYDHSGKLDYLVFYRPGHGVCYILKNTGGQFAPVFASQNGIGGYDLKDAGDRAFAFDYDHSGKLDYLVFYRPGHGVCYILKNTGGQFAPVFASQNGIGGYDLKDAGDRAFAFDYDHSGKLDYLVFYRPGHGVCYILKNTGGQFAPVFASQNGIGGYDLKATSDQALAYDYDGSGKQDHLVLFRNQPGLQSFWILSNQNGVFSPVYQSGNGFHNIVPSQACVFDFTASGLQNYLALYNPGSGYIEIVANNGSPAYASAPKPYPVVVTLSATNITQNTATLNGKVNPEGSPTAYRFEYGPTTNFGSFTPLWQGLSSEEDVHENISGLQPGTTYYFRIFAENAVGGTYGSDVVFTTTPAIPPSQTGSLLFALTPPSSGLGTTCIGATVDPLFNAGVHAVITSVHNNTGTPVKLAVTTALGASTFIIKPVTIAANQSSNAFNGIRVAEYWAGDDGTAHNPNQDLGPFIIDWKEVVGP